jgi:predicted alpha/beta superfamily hydrolase
MRRLLQALILSATCLLSAAPHVAQATTVRVHYDVGYGNRISIRGNKAPLSWNAGVNATWTTGNAWVLSWADSAGDMEIKPLKNDATWSVGANYFVKSGTTVDIYPFFGPAAGTLKKITGFHSPQFNNSRTLILYLPPSYYENPLKRYPVLYAHDGQNLFEAATAFGGKEWRMDETSNQLIGSGLMDEVIIVGIHNTGSNRIYEYTPCCDAAYGGGGADQYLNFMANTVKPYIDANYRTINRRENTATMGSSLGGLLSFYAGRRRSDVFSKVAGMSSSFWWNNEALTLEVINYSGKVPAKFYIDAGTVNDGLPQTTSMRDALVSDGYVQGVDLYYHVAQGAGHNETSWAARLDIPLKYLFPWQSTVY